LGKPTSYLNTQLIHPFTFTSLQQTTFRSVSTPAHYALVLVIALMAGIQCQQNKGNNPGTTLFTQLPASYSGITFRNDLVYDRDFNIYRYRNFYNGGGVATGDVNNDGLPDVFFSSNMGTNRLYLNKGELRFEDVTDRAGVAGKGAWSTGVSMVDLNADGWLDIYVCNSGNPRTEEREKQSFSRENELFINQRDGTFREEAREWGLADRGLSTHAAFFDYDRDGDLDCYILNNSFRAIGSFDLRNNLRFTRDSLGGHKLLRNDATPEQPKRFTDVSQQAGILGSEIAFGLGVTVGDLNADGWDDIYVSNDFFERDYLYYNNQRGGFTEGLETSMRHISAASMGADMADINNDTRPDIFVTDMLPEPDHRIKTTTSFDSPDRFAYTTANGYYNQFTRNMLHLNNGPQPRQPANNPTLYFSDIACLGTCEATDWSWGALITDLDNDGWKDIFVANGIAQDLTNQDYLLFASDPAVQREIVGGGKVDFKRLIDSIPNQPQPNYAFRNNGDLTFTNQAKAWGLDQPSMSNGSAYADFDNDGDLDLVINCNNSEALLYRNETNTQLPQHHYLKIALTGEGLNTQAFGARVTLFSDGKMYYQEQMPMRGFQSAMDPRLNFGIAGQKAIDSLWVEWPNGRTTRLLQVAANQTLQLRQAEANLNQWPVRPWLQPAAAPLFTPIAQSPLNWQHRESNFNDWDRDRMLYFKYSTEGPRLAVADANGDGLSDVYACGAANQPGTLLLQQANGKFQASPQPALQQDASAEDTDAAWLDADCDGDLDLYVASGSNEFAPLSPQLADRLYLNDGKGRLSRKMDALPGQKPYASAAIAPADFDGDGDTDVFVAMRLIPGQVGTPVGGYLMANDGNGYFSPVQNDLFRRLGMPTDAEWADVNADGLLDLIVCGEWMPLHIFLNKGGQLTDATESLGLSNTNGLWKRLSIADFNRDGRPDILVGNMGFNTRLDAQPGQPLTLFSGDFDQNGTPESILCRYNFGTLLPYTLRGDLVGNLPALKKKYLRFASYANQQITDIFSPEQLKQAHRSEAQHLGNAVFLSQPNGTYLMQVLPSEAQFAPMYGITTGDFDGDGLTDAITGGNFHGAKPEFGYADADYGLFLRGDGKGGFTPIRSGQSGLFFTGEVRDLQWLNVQGKPTLLVAKNNAALECWRSAGTSKQ
jgi:enediyne biosynthesis protein E4